MIQHPQGAWQCVHRNRLKRYYRRQESSDSAEGTATTTVEVQEEAEDKRQSLAASTGTGPLPDFGIEEVECLPGQRMQTMAGTIPQLSEDEDPPVRRGRPVRRPAWFKDYHTELAGPEDGTQKGEWCTTVLLTVYYGGRDIRININDIKIINIYDCSLISMIRTFIDGYLVTH